MLCPFMGCGLSDEADLFHCYENLMRRLHSKFADRGMHAYAAKFIALFRELLPSTHLQLEREEIYFDEWCIQWVSLQPTVRRPASSLDFVSSPVTVPAFA